MNVNIHVIGRNDFSIQFKQAESGNVNAIITVGDEEVIIYFHEGKAYKALADIEHAIRVFQMESEPDTAINGVDDSVRLER